MNHVCYISIGSNLGNRILNCQRAIGELEKITEILISASFYETEPWGYEDDNYYINTVIKIKTSYNPNQLLLKLKIIEKKIGRIIKEKREIYESRIIDLDILYFSDIILNKKNLIIPHPKLYQRNYVLKPFCEIDPNFLCPLKNKKITDVFKECVDSNKVSLYIK